MTVAVDARKFMEDLSAWMSNEFGWPKNDKTPFSKDDWTLIVKLHAVIETGLNGAILRDLGKPELAPVVEKLDTSNQATGKAAFAKALGILPKESIVFLQYLSQLRNKCVHDIKNFSFDLTKFLATDEKAGEYLKAINKMVDSKTPIEPRHALIVGAMSIMSELMVHSAKCDYLQEKILRERAESELYHAQQESSPKES